MPHEAIVPIDPLQPSSRRSTSRATILLLRLPSSVLLLFALPFLGLLTALWSTFLLLVYLQPCPRLLFVPLEAGQDRIVKFIVCLSA